MDDLSSLSKRARACTNKEWRATLIQAHIDLNNAINALYKDPTADNMIRLNSQWAFARRVYNEAPPEADPQPPLAGAPVAAVLAA